MKTITTSPIKDSSASAADSLLADYPHGTVIATVSPRGTLAAPKKGGR